MSRGILLVALDFSKAQADEFHAWYDTEHLPERARLPGFGACARWIGVNNDRIAVATYELDDIAALDSPGFTAISGPNLSPWSKRMVALCDRTLRFQGVQTVPGNAQAPASAGGLLINAMNVAAEHEDEFNDWYDTEHIPALSAVPGALAARRFRSADSPRHLALYHLAAPEVQASDAWKAAANTKWTERMRPHFRDHVRIVCRAYRPAD